MDTITTDLSEQTPQAMASTNTPEAITDFLNGKAFLFTKQEIDHLSSLPWSINDIEREIQLLLHVKRQKLPLVLRLATEEEQKMIRIGDPQTGNIILTCTNPNGVTLDNIPKHSTKIWSHGQKPLLAIYVNLLELLAHQSNGQSQLIEKSISAIRHGKFSDRCQENISKKSFGGETYHTTKCNNIIALDKLIKNPLTRQCEHCRE